MEDNLLCILLSTHQRKQCRVGTQALQASVPYEQQHLCIFYGFRLNNCDGISGFVNLLIALWGLVA
jgi:hypothetical protein